MISPILLITLLVRSSTLAVQRAVVHSHPVEDSKESVFSFTREVLRAWSPQKRHKSTALPGLKFAGTHTGQVSSGGTPKQKPDVTVRAAKSGVLTLHNNVSSTPAGMDQQSRRLSSEKTRTDRAKARVDKKVSSLGLMPNATTVTKLPKVMSLGNSSGDSHWHTWNITYHSLRPARLNRTGSKVYFEDHSFMSSRSLDAPVPQPDEGARLKDISNASHLEEWWNRSSGSAVTNSSNLKTHAVSSHTQQHVESDQNFVAACVSVCGLVLATCCLAAFFLSDESTHETEKDVPMHSDVQSTTKTHVDLCAAVKVGDGTWTQDYKSADGNRKMALELLFRCNIIPEEEFARSRVNQEHVDECVWIATHMLRQKSMEDWVSKWMEARLTFEDSVTACYKERTAVLDKRQTESAPAAVQLKSKPPASPSRYPTERQRSAEEAVLSRDKNGENLLVVRCREIMASARSETQTSPGTPSKPATR